MDFCMGWHSDFFGNMPFIVQNRIFTVLRVSLWGNYKTYIAGMLQFAAPRPRMHKFYHEIGDKNRSRRTAATTSHGQLDSLTIIADMAAAVAKTVPRLPVYRRRAIGSTCRSPKGAG